MAAFVAPGDPIAGIFAWETRAGGRADLFIHSESSGNWKTKRRARRKNSADTAAGFACDLRGWTRTSTARQEPYPNRSQWDRHHPRARCLRVDADERFYDRRTRSDPGRRDSRSHTQIY